MNEMYYVIYNGNGDTTVTEFTKEQLLNAIDEKYWGDSTPLKVIPDSDTNYWGEHMLIIKGKIVTPFAEQVVTKYSID